MGFRFRKSKKILPGVRMNFSKKGVGIRFGGKRGGISFGPSGTRVSASIPGTGISYSSKLGGKKRKKTTTAKAKPTKVVQKKTNNKPVPLRTWYIVLAILFLVGGLGSFATDVRAAITGIVIFVLMAFGTVIKFRAVKNVAQQEEAVESEDITI